MKPGLYRILLLPFFLTALLHSIQAQQFSYTGQCDTFSFNNETTAVHWQIIQNNEQGQLVAESEGQSFVHCWERPGSYLLFCETSTFNEPETKKIEVQSVSPILHSAEATPTTTIEVEKGAAKKCKDSLRKIEFTACAGSYVRYERQQLAAGTTQQFVYSAKDGCDSIVQVRVHSLPELEVETSTETTCWNSRNGHIELSNPQGGLAPYRYSINKRNYQTATRFDNLTAGFYTIYFKDSQGCQDSTMVEIPVIEQMRYRVEDRIMQCDQDSVELKVELLSADSNISYQWPDGSKKPSFKVGKPDIYWVKLENECESNFEEVLVGLGEKQDPSYVYFPNAFSPNDDGYNDSYRAYPASGAEVLQYEMNIFDRAGNRVFSAKDIGEGWDGFYLDQLAEAGAYIWYVQAVVVYCYREIVITKEGTLTLLR